EEFPQGHERRCRLPRVSLWHRCCRHRSARFRRAVPSSPVSATTRIRHVRDRPLDCEPGAESSVLRREVGTCDLAVERCIVCLIDCANEDKRTEQGGPSEVLTPRRNFEPPRMNVRQTLSSQLGAGYEVVSARHGKSLIELAPFHQSMDGPAKMKGKEMRLDAKKQHGLGRPGQLPNVLGESRLLVYRLLARLDVVM